MSARRSATASPAAVAVVALVAGLLVVGCLPGARRGGGSESAGPGASGAIDTAAPAPTGPTPRVTIVPPTPTPAPTFRVYTVAKGDSLNTIAHRFGTTARSIAFWNRSTYPSLDPESAGYRPDLLKVGWTLFLIPNDVVDEQALPEPSPDGTDPADATAGASDLP